MNKDTVLKKASDLSQTMRWELLDIIEVLVFRVISTHCNDLIICFSLFE
jgi:hypothetical protein